MSGLPSGIVLERFVPAHLAQFVRDGSIEVWGGVLRWTKETGRGGRIAGFLTEGWALAQQVSSNVPLDLSQLTAAVGNAQMAAQLASGIGVLNLGVNIAGFAIVARRLDRIAGNILVLQDGMEEVGTNVGWLRTDRMHEIRAEVRTALDLADRGARQRNPTLLNEAKTRAGKMRLHVAGHLHDMAAAGSMLREDRLYSDFVSMSVLLALAETRSTAEVEGAGQAALDLREIAVGLRQAADAFVTPLRSFQASPRILLEVAGRRAAVKNTGAGINSLVSRLEAYVPQLELQDALGLDAAGWKALTSPEGSSGVLCLTFDSQDDRDLVEVARGA